MTDVRTLTAVEVISIPYAQLEEIFQANTDFEKIIRRVLASHRKEFEKSLMRKSGRLPELIPSEKSKGRGDFFKYKLMDDEKINMQKQMYHRPFEKLGKWRFIRFIFMKNTIDTNRRFYEYYEISRFTANSILSLVAVTSCNALMKFSYVTIPLTYTCLLLGLVDFYVRMHCQYYNKLGILVTHPLSTAKNYFTTSFIADLWCVFPIFLIDDIFGEKNISYTYMYMAMATRPFAMHRLIGYLNYCQSDITAKRTNLIQSFKFSIVVAEGLAIFATLLQLSTCDIGSGTVVCKKKDTWLGTALVKYYQQPYEVFVTCFYVVTTLFTATSVGEVALNNLQEIFVFFGIILVLFVGRMFLITKLLGTRVSNF